ncbi:MAG TPA: hypothetical protein VJO12_10360 [Stellaceae bacterium]|nr:hypothetical protein [Stellaceae bacterium]
MKREKVRTIAAWVLISLAILAGISECMLALALVGASGYRNPAHDAEYAIMFGGMFAAPWIVLGLIRWVMWRVTEPIPGELE